MKFVQRMCIVALMAQAATPFVRAQETPVTPPQNSKPPGEEGKLRSEEETRKLLEQLTCGPSGVHFSHHTEKGPQPLQEQPPDKGLIYVIRTRSGGSQSKLRSEERRVGKESRKRWAQK